MRDGHAVQISWPLTVNCWSGASFSTRTGRRRNSGSGPCRSTDRVRPALARPVGLRPDTAMRADVWWRPTGRCSSTLTRALTRREAVAMRLGRLSVVQHLWGRLAPRTALPGLGEWPRNSLGCPLQPLKAAPAISRNFSSLWAVVRHNDTATPEVTTSRRRERYSMQITCPQCGRTGRVVWTEAERRMWELARQAFAPDRADRAGSPMVYCEACQRLSALNDPPGTGPHSSS